MRSSIFASGHFSNNVSFFWYSISQHVSYPVEEGCPNAPVCNAFFRAYTYLKTVMLLRFLCINLLEIILFYHGHDGTNVHLQLLHFLILAPHPPIRLQWVCVAVCIILGVVPGLLPSRGTQLDWTYRQRSSSFCAATAAGSLFLA